jgi:hypothetical protein
MSSHYTLVMNAGLKQAMSDNERACLGVLIQGRSASGLVWPSHKYFEKVQGPVPLPSRYAGIARAQWVSELWDDGLGRLGINLILPSIKDDDDLWEHLLLVDWLCSLMDEDRAIGMLLDGPKPGDARLLFAVGGKFKMHWGSGGQELHAAQWVNP